MERGGGDAEAEGAEYHQDAAMEAHSNGSASDKCSESAQKVMDSRKEAEWNGRDEYELKAVATEEEEEEEEAEECVEEDEADVENYARIMRTCHRGCLFARARGDPCLRTRRRGGLIQICRFSLGKRQFLADHQKWRLLQKANQRYGMKSFCPTSQPSREGNCDAHGSVCSIPEHAEE
ncbi:unnamed protein product [Protopolystoma xenopodis]|uniref:Uncharacterized protein n=1 Tax=Protopolystoma xenopodis TaxID=117903 RepID=A0A448X643_9PLAT|nr:unnamed protein product [Protopolystoma xenopodis]